MSFKPEIQVFGEPEWYDNRLRFATREEACAQMADIRSRWSQVENSRVTESTDPVNSAWGVDGLRGVPPPPTSS